MKFLIDAQLPKTLSSVLVSLNHDSLHTLFLPEKNSTPDNELILKCISEDRILISKDKDFVQHLIFGKHDFKLLLVSTGNINNKELVSLLIKNLPEIQNALENNMFVELDNTRITIHF